MATKKKIISMAGLAHQEWIKALKELVEECGGIINLLNILYSSFEEYGKNNCEIIKVRRWHELLSGQKLPQFHEMVVVLMLHRAVWDDCDVVVDMCVKYDKELNKFCSLVD